MSELYEPDPLMVQEFWDFVCTATERPSNGRGGFLQKMLHDVRKNDAAHINLAELEAVLKG